MATQSSLHHSTRRELFPQGCRYPDPRLKSPECWWIAKLLLCCQESVFLSPQPDAQKIPAESTSRLKLIARFMSLY
ncbi:hypothetical protein E2C01_001497 [Portunus trituberculatus]|uniref:Uncharacterized protein n=1 Tax=Portunus trituberculatus TaxID=210409 RepID=A0A5B7CJF5_PORTR|nr:hypothetical protein [Portunus trituberculatus]